MTFCCGFGRHPDPMFSIHIDYTKHELSDTLSRIIPLALGCRCRKDQAPDHSKQRVGVGVSSRSKMFNGIANMWPSRLYKYVILYHDHYYLAIDRSGVLWRCRSGFAIPLCVVTSTFRNPPQNAIQTGCPSHCVLHHC
jgi:hypothetical protein